jgi:hypothetical protein
MSDVKMSDVFKNETNQFIFGSIGRDVYQDIDRNVIDIVGRFDTKEQAAAASLAINSHDKLVEQNKMLREALQFIADTPDVRADECSFVARKALEEIK